MRRRQDEDNVVFRTRVYARMLSELGDSPNPSSQHISQDLAMAKVLTWDGRSTITFSASGIFGVKGVTIREVNETEARFERLLPLSGNQKFVGSKKDWLDGWLVLVDGIPATVTKYPNLTISSDQVDFGSTVDGVVEAQFQFRNYSLTKSVKGTITHVVPNLNNMVSGSYKVILTLNTLVRTIGLEGFIDIELLNANNTPNGLFFELRTRIMEGSRIHISRARWGVETSNWLDESEEELPVADHIPTVFDVG